MNLAVLMMCDNRKAYTEASLISLANRMGAKPYKMFVHDDSGDEAFGEWLYDAVHSRFWEAEIITAPEPRGYSGAMRAAWSHVYDQAEFDFVFHTENDFTFNEPIPIDQMVAILEWDLSLAQVALLRQAWDPKEKRAGGVLFTQPEGTFIERRVGTANYLEHDVFWTSNPSLVPHWVLGLGWPDGLLSEGRFTFKLRDLGLKFAYYGKMGDPPRIDHIGYDRTGTGY